MDVSRLHDLALSDSGFVFDPTTGHTFTVNATGLAVLRGLKAGDPETKIAAALSEGFEMDGGEDPMRDVADFLTSLRALGLVK
jgi:PqqD family protein of HPr-rel-A system